MINQDHAVNPKSIPRGNSLIGKLQEPFLRQKSNFKQRMRIAVRAVNSTSRTSRSAKKFYFQSLLGFSVVELLKNQKFAKRLSELLVTVIWLLTHKHRKTYKQ